MRTSRICCLWLLVYCSASAYGMTEPNVIFSASFEHTPLALGVDCDEACSFGPYWMAGPAGFAKGVRGAAAEFGYEIAYPFHSVFSQTIGTHSVTTLPK